MKSEDIAALKRELLTDLQTRIHGKGKGAVAQGAESLRPDARLAVGQSRHGAELHLEIRVQKTAGPAWRKAEDMKARYPGEVNVAVIESVEVPSSKSVLEHEPHSAFTAPPLRLGSSVSHEDENAPGSLGAFVFDKDGELSILSCSHVLALSGQIENRARVVHPGVGDVVGALRKDHFIGKLGDYTATTRGRANALDAAYALLKEGVAHSGNVIPDGVGAPAALVGQRVTYSPNALDQLQADASLAKIGRTTGYTEGLLNAVGIDGVPVLVHGIGLVYFDNCVEVRWKAVNRPFTRPGDSGAVVFTEGREAVGLHFAAGDVKRDGRDLKISYACDLTAIMATNLFNLTWVP